MHSIVIDSRFVDILNSLFPGLSRFYRVLYNGLSLVTFLPLALLTHKMGGAVVLSWGSRALPVRVFLIGASLALFYSASRKYDLQYFLGIKQLRTGENNLLLSEGGEFSETGVFGMTRHPWYLGSLLLIWSFSGEYPLAVFIAACILSVYLVVGTILEERKIVARFGDAYRRYQQRVSMLFPWKWIKRQLGSRRC